MSMVNILFFIKRKKLLKDGTAPIYIRVTVNKVSSEFATGKSINPSQWIAVKGRVKGNTLLNKQLNTFLDQQEYALHDIALQIQQYGKPVTAKEIARKYKGKDTPQISLVSLYEEHNKLQQELVGISVAYNMTMPIIRQERRMPVMQVVTPIVEKVATNVTGVEEMRLPFIEANTKEVSMQHLKDDCIVPVFSKDNEITISHVNLIESVWNAASQVFPREQISAPVVRVSHVIKGRTPEAIHKPVSALLEEDKTIYYERMMFCFEIPTIYEDIAGNRLNLTIGGVRAYNHENLYSKKEWRSSRYSSVSRTLCVAICVWPQMVTSLN